MNKHEAIKALIEAVQNGQKIGAYKAVQDLLIGMSFEGKPSFEKSSFSVEMRQACGLVREVWLDRNDRPAYIAGMFAPQTLLRVEEQNDGQEETKPEERNEDPFECATRDTQPVKGGYGFAAHVSSADEEVEPEALQGR